MTNRPATRPPHHYFPLQPSLWAATAVPPVATRPLDADATADVAIIGAGYCGLSTALHLAQHGVRALVLEAEEIGFGGSGRSGGQVIPGLKHDPGELRTRFGDERAARLTDFAAGTADAVFDLIGQHAMAVPFVRNGWIQGAHDAAALRTAERRVRDWQQLGVPARLLDRDETARLLGTDRYLGGWLDPRGGGIQPLSYVRELARVATGHGATIHTGSPVTGLRRSGSQWLLRTPAASVRADRVLIATNGYTGALWPGLRRTIIDANSFQVATAVLPAHVRATILPEGHVSSDARNLLLYYRIDHTGRLLMGGRGSFSEPVHPAQWRHLEGVIAKLFPQAAGVPIEYRWCGHVAVTRDFLPHLHEPAPGLLIDIGCQGRGIGLQTRMGEALARYLAGGRRDELPLPPTDIRPMPLFALRRLYLAAIIAWYRLRDGGV